VHARTVGFSLVLLALGARPGAADEAPSDVPRWRVRAALMTGFGGTSDAGVAVAVFPTTVELGARIWGPLSVEASATGVLSGDYYDACGQPRRANAIVGGLGLRFDFLNWRSRSWADPFVEVHGGVGRQPGGRPSGGVCPGGGTFGTGGARAGVDVWLGKAAVTVALGFDYLPSASPFAASIGASFVLY
jgi:hypothetical protein